MPMFWAWTSTGAVRFRLRYDFVKIWPRSSSIYSYGVELGYTTAAARTISLIHERLVQSLCQGVELQPGNESTYPEYPAIARHRYLGT